MVNVPVTQSSHTQHLLQTWGLFQQAYVLSARYFESVTSRFGLSYPQSAVLMVLRGHDKPLPLSQIARTLTQEAQSTTELADRLERRGYVQRIRDQRDRRLVLLSLTDAGSAIIDEIVPALQVAGTTLFGGIEPANLTAFTQLLTDLRSRAGDQLGIDRSRLSGNHSSPAV